MTKHPIVSYLSCAVMALCFAVPAPAADISLPASLPGGFTLAREVGTYDPENLFELINGQAVFYLSYGFTRLDHAFYEKDGETYKADVYQVADDLSALGCFREQMDMGAGPLDVGTEGYLLDYLAAFYKGVFYVEIVPNADGVPADMRALAAAIDDLLPGEAKLPAMLAVFPAEGLVEGSETYFGESLLSYEFLGHGLSAEYQLPGADKALRVFVAMTATPDSAAAVSAVFASRLTESSAIAAGQAGTGVTGELPYRGTSMIFTSGGYAFGCIGATGTDSAATILDKLAANLGQIR